MGDVQAALGYGLIFYFFDDPVLIRQKLAKVVDELSPLVRSPFSRIQTESGRFRTFSGDWKGTLTTLLRESSFESTEYFNLTHFEDKDNGSRKLTFLCRRIQDWFPKKTPNYLYLAFTSDLDKGAIWNAFQNVYLTHPFHMAYGGAVIIRNDELLPKSGSRAADIARNSTSWVNEPESTWMNLSFLENAAESIDGPVEFLGLGPSFRERFALAVARRSGAGADLGAEFGEDYLLFRMSQPEQVRETYGVLQEMWPTYDKPRRFWKDEDWRTWRDRARKEAGIGV